MPTMAIIGAGPGLGIAAARRFGREGYSVALISRTKANVDRLADELSAERITAKGYVGNTREPESLVTALGSAADDLGSIDVLQYSPIPQPEFLKSVTDTRVGDLHDALQFSLFGAFAAINAVLPGMTARGAGTVVLVNGGSAATPNGAVAGTSVAFAAESAYGDMLHTAVAPQGIHVGQLIVPGIIGGEDPLFAPAALAQRLWAIHTDRGSFRVMVAH